jgi:hypothetical protein
MRMRAAQLVVLERLGSVQGIALLIVAIFLDQRLNLAGDVWQILKRSNRFRVERKYCRKKTDNGEHDEANTFLAVIRTVREAYTGAGENEKRRASTRSADARPPAHKDACRGRSCLTRNRAPPTR